MRIGRDSSSRHSSHNTPTSAGRALHTGHITRTSYHHKASPLFPGWIRSPLDRRLDAIGGHREPDREAPGGDSVVRGGHDLEVEVRRRGEAGVAREPELLASLDPLA